MSDQMFYEADGVTPLKGLALVNARKKAIKAAAAAATETPAPTPAAAPPVANPPVVETVVQPVMETPAPTATPQTTTATPQATPMARAKAVLPPEAPKQEEAPPAPTLYDEVLRVSRICVPDFAERHNKEDEQAYLLRMIRAIGGVTGEAEARLDAAWMATTPDFQVWYNRAVTEEIENKRPISVPDGLNAPKASRKTGAEAAKALTGTRSANKQKKAEEKAAKVAEREAAKAAKAAAKASKKSDRGFGAMEFTYIAIIENPGMKPEDLVKHVAEKNGITIQLGTASTALSNCNRVTRLLRHLGKLA